MNYIDGPSTRRAILGKQTVRKEGPSVFSRIWRVVTFTCSCFLKFSCLLVVFAVISLLFISLYEYFLRSPYIKLEKVVVTGVGEDIKAELFQMVKLDFEMSLLAINVDELKRQLEKHPWIRSVSVEKQFPHTLSIHAERQEPWAIVASDRLSYMNRWGEVFKDVGEGEPQDLPVITGLPPSGESRQRALNMAVHVLGTLASEEGRWSVAQLSEVHVKGDGSVYLYYFSLPVAIKAQAKDLGNRMADLKKVVEHLNRSGRVGAARTINLEYADGAVVSFKKG